MASSMQQPVSTHTVVLLGPKERKRLERLAAAEQISAGEILRRSLQAYEGQMPAAEEAVLKDPLREMNTALDAALVWIDSACDKVDANLGAIERMRKDRA